MVCTSMTPTLTRSKKKSMIAQMNPTTPVRYNTIMAHRLRAFAQFMMLVAAVVLTMGCAHSTATRAPDPATLVYVVRHAEKQPGSNPALTPAGRERAALLADITTAANLSAVYSTPYKRTIATARPSAERAGVEVDASFGPRDEAALADHIRKSHTGQTVLVVGHSNTVNKVVAALGGAAFPDLPEHIYDRLYVVTINAGGTAETDERRFGAPTP